MFHKVFFLTNIMYLLIKFYLIFLLSVKIQTQVRKYEAKEMYIPGINFVQALPVRVAQKKEKENKKTIWVG